MSNLARIKPVRLSPSERILRDVLDMSTKDDAGGISDVIVIWTDKNGRQHMRSVASEQEGKGDGR